MSLGNEQRTSILPTASISQFVGPDYDFAAELPLPNEVGVRKGNSLSSVIDGVKGVAYYADMIGFGESSSPFTRGFSKNLLRPLGINYFAPTGAKCSNGADMWTYIEGVPTGEAFGKRVKEALASVQLPGLRGLAPGILEDATAALNPVPIVNTVFGTGYPKCALQEKPVGDFLGRIRGKDGVVWIEDKGDIIYRQGKAFQRKWIQAVDGRGKPIYMDQEQWQAEYDKRQFCPDGSRISSHIDGDCSKPITSFGSGRLPTKEGWKDCGGSGGGGGKGSDKERELLGGILTAVLLVGGVGLYMRLRR